MKKYANFDNFPNNISTVFISESLFKSVVSISGRMFLTHYFTTSRTKENFKNIAKKKYLTR